MSGINRQRGITTIGLIIILGLIAFFTMITLKLFPIYIEYFQVVTSLESLQSEPDVTSKTKPEIVQLLIKRLDVNNVKSVEAKNIEIKQGPKATVIGINYEVREPLFWNLDVVAKFDKSIEVLIR
ncbi:MAG TPA: DUF4845 domain-containing protein [Gammaproteobacteria bacterium]|nr:DUF4845 domain-containing protein [Gammaproteobacteria bacterium]